MANVTEESDTINLLSILIDKYENKMLKIFDL